MGALGVLGERALGACMACGPGVLGVLAGRAESLPGDFEKFLGGNGTF
jgi:hypothetical protein